MVRCSCPASVKGWLNSDKKLSGRSLLRYHRDSVAQVVMENFTAHKWLPWQFIVTPKRWWESASNQKTFIQWLQAELNISQLDHWYSVRHDTILCQSGGAALLNHFGSLREALSQVYPNHPWQTQLFATQPRTGLFTSNQEWSSDKKTQFSQVEQILTIRKPEDWYSVSLKQIRLAGGTLMSFLLLLHPKSILLGASLLDQYANSLPILLSSVYSKHEWLPWRFRSIPRNFWEEVNNARAFLDWVAKDLKLNDLEGWYNVNYRLMKSKYKGTKGCFIFTHFPTS